MTVGQEDAWEVHEAVKECDRRDRDYRTRRSDYRPERFRPLGNPGPGTLARVAVHHPKAGTCSYAWSRERSIVATRDHAAAGIRCTFTCPSSQVLNVDAYQPGDFKRFFADPRTRADYLKWAPLLLEAEEYHAGNREVAAPPAPAPAGESSWEGKRRYRLRKRRMYLKGRAVRLTRSITTIAGKAYEVGSLWRVTGGKGALFSLAGIESDGRPAKPDAEGWRRRLIEIPESKFEEVLDVPAATRKEIEDETEGWA